MFVNFKKALRLIAQEIETLPPQEARIVGHKRAYLTDRQTEEIWNQVEELVILEKWEDLNTLLETLKRAIPITEYNTWADTIQSMLPQDVYLDPYTIRDTDRHGIPVNETDLYTAPKVLPHPISEGKVPKEFLIGEDVQGKWIHILPTKTLGVREERRDEILNYILEEIYTTLTANGEISVSDFSQNTGWLFYGKGVVGIVFEGVVSQLYSADVWSRPLPSGDRVPSVEKELKEGITEGFLDPRKAEPIALVVFDDMDPIDQKNIESIAQNIGLEFWVVENPYKANKWPTKAQTEETTLEGLEAEAQKAGSWENFKNDYLIQLKHGLYWHLTDTPSFDIDLTSGPRDMSSLSTGLSKSIGNLMVTSDIENWDAYYNLREDAEYGQEEVTRPYAALIDLSRVPRNAYYQVSRGFGNEFFVTDPSLAKVVNVFTIEEAIVYDQEYDALLPRSEAELKSFYESVVDDQREYSSPIIEKRATTQQVVTSQVVPCQKIGMSLYDIDVDRIINTFSKEISSKEDTLDYMAPEYLIENGRDPYELEGWELANSEDGDDFIDWLKDKIEGKFYDKKYDFSKIINEAGEIMIYRKMSVEPEWIENLATTGKHLGIYWSWDEYSAEAHWGKLEEGYQQIMLVSSVHESYVDWEDTFFNNIGSGEEEREIRLFRNTPLKLHKLYVNDEEVDISDLQNKTFYASEKKDAQKSSIIDEASNFPEAGTEVCGLEVRGPVPNMESIESSLEDYTVLPGIREISMGGWNAMPRQMYVAQDDIQASYELAEEIEHNGWISPLIVGVETNDIYIIEGGHRLAALAVLGVDAFPALVVIDNEVTMGEDSKKVEAQQDIPWQEGKSLEELGYTNKYVTIYRALPENNPIIREGDFITLNRQFAKDHAVTSAIYEEEPFAVVRKSVPSEHITCASNPGEYLYTGNGIEASIIYVSEPSGEINYVRGSSVKLYKKMSVL